MSLKFAAFAFSLNMLCAGNIARAQTASADSLQRACASLSGDHASMDHAAHTAMTSCESPMPTMAGQAAFGAIGEVVRLLKADPRTDWSRVDVEALRRHLIDMDDVVMHASAKQRAVAGGVSIEVSGTGRSIGAIQRMLTNHIRMLDGMPEYRAAVAPTATGVTVRIQARDTSDARRVAEIRGLGFAGLLTEGDHHAAHHLAIARGDADAHGR